MSDVSEVRENADAAAMEPIVSTRFVWVFEEVTEFPDRSWKVVKYFITEYPTDRFAEAVNMAEREYCCSVRGAQRRALTLPEYCAVLRCNNEGEHNQKVWQAMLRIVFTGSLSSC
jgi:hypothetical protein